MRIGRLSRWSEFRVNQRSRSSRAGAGVAIIVACLAVVAPAGGETRTHSASLASPPLRPFTPVRVNPLALVGIHTVSVEVVGSGSVVSTPGTIDCPDVSCSTQLASLGGASTVTLTAKPAVGFHLDRWGGSCGGITPTCSFSLGSDVAISAIFAPTLAPAGTNAVHVTLPTGAPDGLVTSTPPGISCPGVCDGLFAANTPVTLVSSPNLLDVTHQLQWNTDCQAPAREAHSCTILTSTPSETVAPLIVARPVLNLFVSGPGSVHIAPTGLDRNLGDWASDHCGSGSDARTTCVADYHQGDKVTLKAQAAPGARFLGWGSPDCGTNPTCVVKIAGYTELTANFSPVAFTVYPSGSGTITIDPGGTVCNAQCSVRVPLGSTLTLTATPSAGHTLSTWRGCVPADPTAPTVCSVVVSSSEQSASPIFDDGTQLEFLSIGSLKLVVFKAGQGIVSATPPRSDGCNPNCTNKTSLSVGGNEKVVLTATDAPHWKFDHWGTTCPTPTDRTCTVFGGWQNAVRATFKHH